MSLQRRIHQAKVDAVARSVGRRRRRWPGRGRRFGGASFEGGDSSDGEPIVADLRDPGEDVWRGFRF